ncbi:MAG: DoxX family protein [Phycisphaerales bacterium]
MSDTTPPEGRKGPGAAIDRLDESMVRWMHAFGHAAHRYGLALLFVWFGALKTVGHPTTTSLLAQTIYFGDPKFVVPILGCWEVGIGVCLLVRRLNRVGLLLLIIRLPGTFLALVLMPDVCFSGSVLVPTPQGQYLIKDLVLFTAALIIGGTVRRSEPKRVYH